MIRVLNMSTLGLGGAETTLMHCYRNIDRTKIQFDFLVVNNKPNSNAPYYEGEAISLGARVFHQSLKRKTYFKDILSLYKLFKGNSDIRIIHIHGSKAKYCAQFSTIARFAGVPTCIVHSHSAPPRTALVNKLCQPILRFTATHWLACSTEAGQSLFGKKKFIGHKKAMLFPNARDLEPFRYSKERRKNARMALGLDKEKVLLNVGRLIPIKNQAFLLNAFALSLESETDLILLIAGRDQGIIADLEKKALELGIEKNVRFLGERNDIPELLQAADLFLLPSIREGLPGAAIEAQAAGLPCLLSDTITKESKVSKLVEFLPIDKGPEVWASHIINRVPFARHDTIDDVRNAGYDVKDLVKKLERFYFSLL